MSCLSNGLVHPETKKLRQRHPFTTSLSKFVILMSECANPGTSSSVNFCFKRLQINCLSFNWIPEDTKFFEDFSFLQAWLQDALDAWSDVHC